jgi:hypothetical protein
MDELLRIVAFEGLAEVRCVSQLAAVVRSAHARGGGGSEAGHGPHPACDDRGDPAGERQAAVRSAPHPRTMHRCVVRTRHGPCVCPVSMCEEWPSRFVVRKPSLRRRKAASVWMRAECDLLGA